MANTTISTSMLLPIPVVGVDPSPDWAADINSCLTIIDGHDHSPGYGVPITPDGLNISGDLSIQSNNLTLVKSVRFDSQGSPLAGGSDLGCLYEVGDDLYYNDGSGNQIRMTQSGSIAGTSGSITGLVAPASATYVAISGKFVFQSAANTAADLDGRSLILRNATASSNGLTLAPPLAMSASYTLTLPALPASTSLMTVTSGGAMSSVAPDNTTIGISGGQLHALFPPGMIVEYGATPGAPAGWLRCDGSAVSRTTYSDLFAIIGTIWGVGDGSTTFNVPDLRGRFSFSDGGGETAGQTGGARTKTLSTTEIPSHTHPQVYGVTGGITGNAWAPNVYDTTSATGSFPTGATGGGTAFSIMPPFAVVGKIIKT